MSGSDRQQSYARKIERSDGVLYCIISVRVRHEKVRYWQAEVRLRQKMVHAREAERAACGEKVHTRREPD